MYSMHGFIHTYNKMNENPIDKSAVRFGESGDKQSWRFFIRENCSIGGYDSKNPKQDIAASEDLR